MVQKLPNRNILESRLSGTEPQGSEGVFGNNLATAQFEFIQLKLTAQHAALSQYELHPSRQDTLG